MRHCRQEFFVICSILLFTVSTAQNFIHFDKVVESENDNEIIPSVFRKNLPITRPIQPPKQNKPLKQPQFQQLHPQPVIKITINREKLNQQPQPVPQATKQQQHKREQSEGSGPPLIILGNDGQQHQQLQHQQQQHGVQPRQVAQSGKSASPAPPASPIMAAADGSGNYHQQYQNGFAGQRYLPPQVVNPGFPAWNSGSGCSSCTSYDYSYRQRCCTYGHRICCTVNPPLRPNPSYGHTGIGILGQFDQPHQQYNYQSYGNDRWGWNNRDKPGTCYRPSYQTHFGNNQGWNPHASNNHNAGYYFERADVDIDRDFTPEVGHGGYNHQTQSYGVPAPHYSGGGGYGSSGGFHDGGGGGYGGGGGHRPHYQWSSCRKDFECPGNQKCCYGRCSTPSFIG